MQIITPIPTELYDLTIQWQNAFEILTTKIEKTVANIFQNFHYSQQKWHRKLQDSQASQLSAL